jgi:hypothetical protein
VHVERAKMARAGSQVGLAAAPVVVPSNHTGSWNARVSSYAAAGAFSLGATKRCQTA